MEEARRLTSGDLSFGSLTTCPATGTRERKDARGAFMTKILVLGATGNIGGLTTAALAANYPDISLRLASSRPEGRSAMSAAYPVAQVVEADWYDLERLTRAVEGVDKVLMVTPDFRTDESVATKNVIEAVKRAGGVQQIVRFIAIPPGLTADKLAPEFLATRCGANLHTVAKPLFDASGLPMTYINAACWIMFNLPWFMADEVKRNRRIAMPAASDARRLWISENDIADVAAKILADPAAMHVGKEYLVTGTERLDFRGVASLVGDVLGTQVTYVDDDASLRAAMGDQFDTLMTYFRHETRDYGDVPSTDTVARLLGRPQVTLRDYIEANKSAFE
jgi:NAD(P)H dehydrogenase (quinone)